MNNTFTPKVTGLNGYGLEVPDLETARNFYTEFGLQAESIRDSLHLKCEGRLNSEIVIRQAGAKRLHHVSFYIQPGSLGQFVDHLKQWDLDIKEHAPDGFDREGIWFKDQFGLWINLEPHDPQADPVVKLPDYNFGGHINRVDKNLWQMLERDSKPKPMHLGHVLIFTPDWIAAENFFTKALGLRTTDRIQGKGVFMNAGTGIVDHHCFAFVQSTHLGIQHSSFYVSNFDDIGYGAWHMRNAGYKYLFGPGRHAIASNLFTYIQDPWGSWIEYYSDMDKVTENWICRDWQSLPYTWGPEWSPEFWSDEMNINLEPR